MNKKKDLHLVRSVAHYIVSLIPKVLVKFVIDLSKISTTEASHIIKREFENAKSKHTRQSRVDVYRIPQKTKKLTRMTAEA